MANAVRCSFNSFVLQDSIAMVLSICAIGIFSIASFPIKNKKTVLAYLLFGNILTMTAMCAMVSAFVEGLQAVLDRSSFLKVTTGFILPVFWLLFFVLVVHAWAPPRWLILYLWQKNWDLYNNVSHFSHVSSLSYCLCFYHKLSITFGNEGNICLFFLTTNKCILHFASLPAMYFISKILNWSKSIILTYYTNASILGCNFT